ncbi:MAG: sensor histidine kinase [Ferruginibacter sp.]
MTGTIKYGAFLFFVLIFFLSTSQAQLSRLDSLKNNITVASSPTNRLKATLAFCEEWESFNADTLYKYALLAKKNTAAEKNDDALVLSDYYIAAYLFQKNKLDTALKAIDRVIDLYKKNNGYSYTFAKFWLLRANVLMRSSNYEEVLKQDLNLLTLAEDNHDSVAMIRFNTSIGNVNLRLKKIEEALKWHYKAINLMQTDALKSKCSFVFVNLAVAYHHLYTKNDTKQNEDSMEVNLQKAIKYSRQGGTLTNLANGLSLYADILAEEKKLLPAEAALTEAVAIRKKIGDVFYIIADMIALSSIYENNNIAKAIEINLQALDLAKKNGSDFFSMTTVYSSLGEIYSIKGDYKKYSEVLQEEIKLQDSMYKVNTAEAVTEIEARYDLQKKQTTIIQQQYDLVKKNYLFYGSLFLLLLGTIFSFILFKQNRRKQQLKLQMLHEEEQRTTVIAVEKAEEYERNRIAAELHDNLGSQLSYISSNIDFLINAPSSLADADKNERLGKLNQTAKNTITDLRETIWALKKESVEIEELADRLKLHAQNQLSHKSGIKLSVHENSAVKIVLTSAEALNIFRIFQEAVNNAVKYSKAKEIILSVVTEAPSKYSISLADNGSGFDANVLHKGHYGLENMKERAKVIHATLEITSSENNGTLITLSKY